MWNVQPVRHVPTTFSENPFGFACFRRFEKTKLAHRRNSIFGAMFRNKGRVMEVRDRSSTKCWNPKSPKRAKHPPWSAPGGVITKLPGDCSQIHGSPEFTNFVTRKPVGDLSRKKPDILHKNVQNTPENSDFIGMLTYQTNRRTF